MVLCIADDAGNQWQAEGRLPEAVGAAAVAGADGGLAGARKKAKGDRGISTKSGACSGDAVESGASSAGPAERVLWHPRGGELPPHISVDGVRVDGRG